MTVARRTRPVVALRAAVVAAAGIAIGCTDPTLGARTQRTHRVVEKGPYQSVYGTNGKLVRLLQDRNGDRTADAIIHYSPSGEVRQAEIDADLDGVIDRWEYFEEGKLIRVGFPGEKPGVPAYWDRVGPTGVAMQREYDADGDGLIDRIQPGIAPPPSVSVGQPRSRR